MHVQWKASCHVVGMLIKGVRTGSYIHGILRKKIVRQNGDVHNML